MINRICDIREKVRLKKPLIHCITNPISINQCANAILSVGAKPIMAEHPMEVHEITATADALMLNIGNITDARLESIRISLETAKEKDIPVLLDVVGIACSGFRRRYIMDLLSLAMPDVIKGNYSEIMALCNVDYSSSGVDAEPGIGVGCITKAVSELATRSGGIILATGQTDIITDGKTTVYVKNGTYQLATVTGTGCMLGSLCSAFMTSAVPMDAVVSACVYFGICGELARTNSGNGSFMVNLMDRMTILKNDEIARYMNVEELK
ncbi:MAG: hydroxyethylthiazole kinase [Ruminococcaceae bacterium]|nr:hydroxyethylthiazole kinase [Oscillospiraceae bacterium]